MNQDAALKLTAQIGGMIGEIMEDHAPMALSKATMAPEWSARLERAGEDIAQLARAAVVIARRAEGTASRD